ncbi:hypothetical protein Tco_0337399 [Tanacetum coccineum]
MGEVARSKVDRKYGCLESEVEDDRVCEIQMVVRKKVNSGYVVENVLMRCGGAYVWNEGNKKYNKHKEGTLCKRMKHLCFAFLLPILSNQKGGIIFHWNVDLYIEERIDIITYASPRSLLPFVLRRESMGHEHHLRGVLGYN